MKRCLAGLFALIMSASAMAQEKLQLTLPFLDNERDRLVVDLLTLTLENQGIELSVRPVSERISEGRLIAEIRSGNIDVAWAGMASDFEAELKPIRIPLFKGILGHRIFVIRQDDQHRFDHIETLNDLKKLNAGQGRFWGDAKVLEAAGLPVVTTVKSLGLWHMLDGGRFDYFPLAIHEPWSELEKFNDLDLTVESQLMLVYPFAMYFYVGQDNQHLHDIIARGMNATIADGSYDRFLFNSPLFKEGFAAANIARRRVLRIANPFMHPATPVDTPQYWLDVEAFAEKQH